MAENDARLARLEKQLARLAVIVEGLDARLQAISADTAVMARHVGFVEGIYEQVKRPFFLLCGAVDRYASLLAPATSLRGLSDAESNTARPSNSSSS